MRVAQVNDIAFVGSTLVRALREEGISSELIEPARPGAGIAYPWKAVTLPLRVAGLVSAGMHVRRGGFDLAHVHYARLGLVGPIGGRPYVLHCHGSDIRGVRPRSPWGVEVAPFLRGAALVYYATPDLRPWVEAFRRDSRFLPNPIEIPEDAAPEEPRFDVLVGVRLHPIKGSESIASTLAAVRRLRPGTTVTIVDQGPDVPLVREAAGSPVRVIRPVPHEEMPRLLRAHRVAVGQLRLGALGNHELEALATGTPVATAFSFQDAYDEAPPILEAPDPERLAALIVGLLDDEGARRALGDAGRRWVATHHGSGTIATRVAADYRSILAGR
ncbi:MAG TPA: glycosyltransferase family 4 protein [Candidatus Dormibacteraeota bacterium]|nr:glycosyltransferase family 4 protein [Candidatus Dormibacteraeota bacterium]